MILPFAQNFLAFKNILQKEYLAAPRKSKETNYSTASEGIEMRKGCSPNYNEKGYLVSSLMPLKMNWVVPIN